MLSKGFSRLAALLALALTATGLAMTGTPANAAPRLVQTAYHVHAYSARSLCLEVTGRSVQNSAQVQQYTCNGGMWQEWLIFQPIQDVNWVLMNNYSEKCANVQGNTTTNGSKIIQYDCGASASKFKMTYSQTIGGKDYYRFSNPRATAKCINIQGASSQPGADAIQWDCGTTYGNDLFTWEPV